MTAHRARRTKIAKKSARLYTPPPIFLKRLSEMPRGAPFRGCASLSGLLLDLFGIALADAANGACPVVGNLLEGVPGAAEIRPTSYTDNIYRRNHPSALFAKRFRGCFCCRPGRFGHSVSENYFTANSSIITFIAIFVDDRNHLRFLVRQSIRKLNDLVNTTLSMTPNPIFIGGGGIFDGPILNRVRRCFRVPDRRDFKWQTSRQTTSPPRNSGSYSSN